VLSAKMSMILVRVSYIIQTKVFREYSQRSQRVQFLHSVAASGPDVNEETPRLFG